MKDNMTITLREITKDNWYKAAKLKVSETQQNFVAPNWYSMLEVAYNPDDMYHRAIYAAEEMVGYAMMGRDPEDGSHGIWRLMIADDHQGKGYGRAAMQAIIKDMKVRYQPEALFITFEPENIAARKLYESLGFVDTGELIEGEVLFRLPLNS